MDRGALALAAGLAAYVVRLARREYRDRGALSARTLAVPWTAYLLHAALVVTSARSSRRTLPLPGVFSSPAGVALSGFGLALYAAGVVGLGSYRRTSGLKTDEVVGSGVYRRTRNPQLVGWGLALSGISLLGRSRSGLTLVLPYWLANHAYLVFAEEPHLERAFGSVYREYASAVPRYLDLPGRSLWRVVMDSGWGTG